MGTGVSMDSPKEFDGMVVCWNIAMNPNSILVNDMFDNVVESMSKNRNSAMCYNLAYFRRGCGQKVGPRRETKESAI